MLKALYDWAMNMARHRHAYWAVGTVSFLDSSILPIPPDIIMVPMMVARRESIWRIAAVCTVASIAGAYLGYAIGYFLFEMIGQPLLDFYGYMDHFAAFQAAYNKWGVWIVIGGGLTPFPFKIVTIASGATQLDLLSFTIGCLVSRAPRFFLEGALLWYCGPWVKEFIEKRLALVTTMTFLLIAGGFVAAKYLF